MLIGALARTPGTLLHRKLVGDEWSLTDHLLALVHDQLAVANWQRQGKKGAKRPDPVSPLAKPREEVELRAGRANGRTPEDVIAQLERNRRPAVDPGG